jgi:hypothetical protein
MRREVPNVEISKFNSSCGERAIKITPIGVRRFANQNTKGRSPMKPTTTDKNTPSLSYKRDASKLPILFILALLISLSACGGSRSIQGKWEADIASKRSGPGSKVVFEFLPDGTFNAMPPGDTTVVDKDQYQLLEDGRTLKIRTQLLGGDPVCQFTGDAIQCETETANINFKRL